MVVQYSRNSNQPQLDAASRAAPEDYCATKSRNYLQTTAAIAKWFCGVVDHRGQSRRFIHFKAFTAIYGKFVIGILRGILQAA
jgi:hypothetical protein